MRSTRSRASSPIGTSPSSPGPISTKTPERRQPHDLHAAHDADADLGEQLGAFLALPRVDGAALRHHGPPPLLVDVEHDEGLLRAYERRGVHADRHANLRSGHEPRDAVDLDGEPARDRALHDSFEPRTRCLRVDHALPRLGGDALALDDHGIHTEDA